MTKFVRVISSMKTAVVLILLLILLSIVGSIIPQGRELIYYPTQYGEIMGTIILAAHFNNFFRSATFLVPSGLLFINLTVCSILRFYRRFRKKAPLRLGPDIIHLSLLMLIVLGVFVLFTRQETTVVLGAGDSFHLPGNTEIKLLSFDIEYYPEGRPKDWKSKVLIIGQETTEVIIEVNKPLKIGSFGIFQSSYNIKPLAIVDKEGETIELKEGEGIPLEEGSLFLMDSQETSEGVLGLFYFMKDGNKEEIEQVVLESGNEYRGIVIQEIFNIKESGLQIVYQPGNWIIIMTLFLFCIGLGITFYQKIGDGNR